METDQYKEYYIDRDLNSYKSFFDHDWARTFSDEAKGFGLADLAFNLCESWKGAANTAMLPWLVVETLGLFADEFCNNREPASVGLVNALSAQLGAQVQPPLSSLQHETLRHGINVTSKQLSEQLRLQPYKFDRPAAWKEMLTKTEFSIAVLASRRVVYADIYFAYEHFLLSCFRLVTGNPESQTGRTFPAELAKHYGVQTADEVWNHEEVRLARLVRNAIAHNGARETPALAKMNHPIAVVDGTLQITPTATRVTYNFLKCQATVLLRETARLLPKTPSAVLTT